VLQQKLRIKNYSIVNINVAITTITIDILYEYFNNSNFNSNNFINDLFV